MPKLTHFKQMSDLRFLGSWDLCTSENEDGEPMYEESTRIIEKIGQEEVFEQNTNSKKVVTVCYFKNSKPMILNKTNMKNIEKALKTPFIEHWIGKAVTIKVESVEAFGKTSDALRIKSVAPKTGAKKFFTCENCGDMEVPEIIARRTKKKFGEILCSDCEKVILKEEENAELDDGAGEIDG